MDQNDFANAQQYYNRALIMSSRYGFYNNMADIYISLGDLFIKTGEHKDAMANVKEAIRYSSLLDNDFMLMRSWLSLGKLQNLENQEKDAILSLRTCLAVATEKFGDAFFLHQVYRELGKAYAATGDFKQSYAAFLTYDRLKDSVFTAEADQRVAKLQTEFEVAQKETTIKGQQQFIAQQRRLQWITLGAAGLLIFFLVALYRNYKSKQRINATLENFNSALELKNSQLDKRNAENELLMKEIHHRVKNNLEVVSSLLALQSAQIIDPNTREAMLESQNRVQSIGIVHQKLYQGTHVGAIEMRDYFFNLGESIIEAFGAESRVTINCDMEPVEVDIDTAVPIGLIVNELLTNALKYAFPAGSTGEVRIKLEKRPGGKLCLEVADNGVGKSGKIQGTGFGSQLVDLLTRQLNGTMREEVKDGTHTFFVFQTAKSV
jgi:two-component sensor histidine kinase